MPSSYCDEKKIKEEGDEKPANGQPMEVDKMKTKTKVEPSSLPDGKSRSVTLSFSFVFTDRFGSCFSPIKFA